MHSSKPVQERRLYPRFSCQGNAELRVAGASEVHWGTVTDVSLGGCYVETASQIPNDREVHLKLTIAGYTADVEGRVVVSHPLVGMAILFISMHAEARATLRNMIGVLSGGKPPAAPQPRTVKLTPQSAIAVLQDISSHFKVNRTLTAQQFAEILDRIAGSNQ